MKKIVFWSTLGILSLLLLLLPQVASRYILAFFLSVFMYIALSEGWNILSGYTGYISFGHVAFYGTGAYTAAIFITKYGVRWQVAAIIGGLAATILALLTSYILRLRGRYFAISTLVYAETCKLIAFQWDSLTKGAIGISLPPYSNLVSVYYVMGIVAIISILVVYLIDNSAFGLRLIAIREDEDAAEVLGINTTKHKILAFLLSAFFPGVVGGLNAWWLSYIEPETTFAVIISVQLVVMTLFGGKGTIFGPIIGTAFLYTAWEFLWARFTFLHEAFFGVLIIGIILFLPQGVIGTLKERGYFR